MSQLNTRVTNAPTNAAPAGTIVFDKDNQIIYVSISDTAVSWTAIPFGDIASAMGLTLDEMKFRRLLAWMAAEGIGIPPGLEADTELGLKEFDSDLEDFV